MSSDIHCIVPIWAYRVCHYVDTRDGMGVDYSNNIYSLLFH